MTAQEHIISELKKLAEPVVMQDIGNTPIEEAIFAKVMSKKFRKIKADEQSIDVAKKAIHWAVENNKPVKLNAIFGGNKLWHFEEAPEIDWAEVFACIYFANWLKSIASVHKPGAYLEFYSEDVVLEGMNNMPTAESDQYQETFRSMLEWLKQFLPEGIAFGYKRYAEEYNDISEYEAELEEAKALVLKELGGKLPQLSEKQVSKTELNVRLKPGQADDPLWREKAELIHLSIERTKTLQRYMADTTMIATCTLYYPGCIATGSTKRSYAKFWVAVGALEPNNDGFSELVLTPKQLEAAEYEWQDINLEGLKGKNFSRIRVLKNKLFC